MTDLLDALESRAQRGLSSGADEVFARAVSVPRNAGPDRPRRLAAAMAVVVVLALVAAAVLAARADEAEDQGPTEVPDTAEVLEGSVFGLETGTTLLTYGVDGRLVTLDLDTRTMEGHPDVVPASGGSFGPTTYARVQDRLVFVHDGSIGTIGVDFGDDVTSVPWAEPPERPNQTAVWVVPSGSTDRFWVVQNPLTGNVPTIAEEQNLAGEVVHPPRELDPGAIVVGATSELLATTSAPAEVELRDRTSWQVVDTLPGKVLGVVDDRIVWQPDCGADTCPVQIRDAGTGEDAEVDVDGLPFPAFGAVSPDGLRLAVTGVDDPQLLVADLDTGEVTDVDVGAWDGTNATGPLWSPDSQWVFLSHDPDGRLPGYVDGGLLGYRVGEPSVRIVNIPGVSTALMQTIPRADQAPATRPCGVPLESEPIVGPCLVDVEPVDGPPPPSDDAVDPASINVVVANGSGISGAAGEVSDRLAALGYPTPIPTDTTAPAEETPLDTVFYATNPDSSPQARQVAADLGLPDTAVLPYPGVDDASADMGLAQVLVVLGSSPGMLATGGVPDGPFRGAPTTELSDGDEIVLQVGAFFGGQQLEAIECAGEACDPSTSSVFGTPSDVLVFTVKQVLETEQGRIDCLDRRCQVVVRRTDGSDPSSIGIFFA